MKRRSILNGLQRLLLDRDRLESLNQLRLLMQTDFKDYPHFKREHFKYRSLMELIEVSKQSLKSLRRNRGLNSVHFDGSFDNTPTSKKDTSNVTLNLSLSKINKQDIKDIWEDMVCDFNGFCDVFVEDVPYLFYDIMYYLGFVEFPSRELRINEDDVFGYYNEKSIGQKKSS